jgi:hypothetical protein
VAGSVIAAAIIIFGILFFTLKKRKTDLCKSKTKGYIVIPCTAATKNLASIVKAYYWEEVFESCELARRILLVQLEKSENTYISKMLEQQYSIVTSVDISELADFFKRERYWQSERD